MKNRFEKKAEPPLAGGEGNGKGRGEIFFSNSEKMPWRKERKI
jgi:hypothetical protein